MLLTTTETIPDKDFSILGVVTGSVVRTKHVGRDIMAGFRQISGGEIYGYTELLNESRVIANERLVEAAKKLGANGVVGLRYSSSSITPGANEIMAYGTAVKYT